MHPIDLSLSPMYLYGKCRSSSSRSSKDLISSSSRTSPGRNNNNPWSKYTHLDGGVYFLHRERHILTVENVHDPTVSADVLRKAEEYLVGFINCPGRGLRMEEEWEMHVFMAGDTSNMQLDARIYSWGVGYMIQCSSKGT